MLLYTGTTLAFSTKSNVWKTRYSFTPTCYMTSDNDFLSSHTSIGSTRLTWKHDESLTYNSFHDQLSVPSSLEVVSNNNPSSVKIFKSLSIESSALGWQGSVYTNKDRERTALQVGNFAGFVEKEGNQYSSMPRSVINSSSNITFVGQILAANLVPTVAAEALGLPEPFNADGSWNVPLINTPDVSISFGEQTVLFVSSNNNPSYLTTVSETGNIMSASEGSYPLDAIKMTRYNEAYNSLTVRFSTPILSQVISIMQGFVAGSQEFLSVYAMTNPALDGDTMRGPYAGVKLTLPNSSESFELFAINVDYEKTKLDGSLG